MTYWYEKYAVIAVGKWFQEKGFEVRISVPGKVNELSRLPLGGLPVPEINPRDFRNPQYRYNVYYDTPGTIDLVAKSQDELWVFEAKGISTRSNGPGKVAQAVGQMVMLMTKSVSSVHYGLIFPDESNFVRALHQVENDNPIFVESNWHIFLVSQDGAVNALTFSDFVST